MSPSSPIPTPGTIPRVARSSVRRSELIRRLDSLAPLTVIRGLSGTGKTTLAAQWALSRQTRGDVVWWFNAADIAEPSMIINTIRSSRAPSSGVRVAVVDDAHYLTDPDVQSVLITELAQAIDLHVVICTRVAHEFVHLADDAGIGTIGLSGGLLNVTAEQIPTYAESWGHRVSPQLARRLYRELGGWLGALRRALDSAEPDHDPLGTHAAARYLADDVHTQITDESTLVAAMAVATTGHVAEPLLHEIFRLDTPTGELLQGRSVPELIEELAWHGFLEPVHLSNDQGWRYPTLLGSILTGVLEADYPNVASHVHETTARWLADRKTLEADGLVGLVVAHARAAGEWELLARMWKEYGICLAIFHVRNAIAAYYDLPDEVLTEHPALALASSVISAIGPGPDQPHRDSPIRNYCEAGWTAYALAGPPQEAGILEITARMISARQCGEVSTALQLAAGYAEQHLGPQSSQISLLHLAWFKLQWAMTCFAARDSSKAIGHLISASHHARMVGADAIVSAAAAQLALMNTVAGYTSTAAEHLVNYRLVHAEDQWMDHPVRAAARIAQGLLQLDRLAPSAATRQFDIAGADYLEEWAIIAWARTQHALLFDDPILAMTELNRVATLHRHELHEGSTSQVIIDRCLADLYLALGEFNRCQWLIEETGADRASLAVPEARLALICGDYTTARAVAGSHAWNPGTNLRDRIDLVVLDAAAALKLDDTVAAQSLFSQAHHLAAEARTLIPFTTLPTRTLDELLNLIGDPLDEDVLARIRRCNQPYPEKGELIVLSPRERVVLRAMVEHETLAEVADALVVSLNTIKKQAHSVCAKLGVHNRQSALLEARRLGLLDMPA